MNMRLHIVLASLFSVLSVSARSGEQLESIFKAFSESHVTIEAAYEIQSDNKSGLLSSGMIVGEAKVTMQGKMYSMDGNGITILCDGKAACITDASAREVIYEPVAGDINGGYMVNPAVLFGRIDENFKVKGSSVESGMAVYDFSSDPATGIDSCRLYLDQNTGTLKSVRFDMADGSKVKISVSVFNVEALRPESEYTLPPVSSFGPDWIVTDLR